GCVECNIFNTNCLASGPLYLISEPNLLKLDGLIGSSSSCCCSSLVEKSSFSVKTSVSSPSSSVVSSGCVKLVSPSYSSSSSFGSCFEMGKIASPGKVNEVVV